MTIPGISYDGWLIHPDFRTQPAPLVRSPRMDDLTKVFEDKKDKTTRKIY